MSGPDPTRVHAVKQVRPQCGYKVCRSCSVVVVCRCGWRSAHQPYIAAIDAHSEHLNSLLVAVLPAGTENQP